MQQGEESQKTIASLKTHTFFHAAGYKHAPILKKNKNFMESLENAQKSEKSYATWGGGNAKP